MFRRTVEFGGINGRLKARGSQSGSNHEADDHA